MNIFRLIGDVSHQVAIILLILQLKQAKNARGISLKTQELRLLVFCTRYLDLFVMYSWYNSIVKVYYITATAGIIYSIKYTEPFKSIYNFDQDSFPHWTYCVAPSLVLALLTSWCSTRPFGWMETLWRFSFYLESVAILPQLLVLRKYRLVEKMTGRFLCCLGIYRLLYIVNWWYRSNTERQYRHVYQTYICGVVQVVLYLDFFNQYCRVTCGRALFCWQQNFEDGGADDDEDGQLVFEMSGDPRIRAPNESQAEPLLGIESENIVSPVEDLRRRGAEV